MTKRELLEQRAGLIAEAEAILNGAGDELNAESQERFDKVWAEADSLQRRAEKLDAEARVGAAKAELEKPVGRIAGAMRAASGAGDAEYREAFFHYLRSGDASEVRVLSTSTAASPYAGYTVPETTEARIVEKLYQDTLIRQIATVRSTPDDRKIPLEVSLPTAAIIGEGSAISASDPVFAQATVGAHKYASRVIANRELLADSTVDLESWVMDKMTLAIARAQDEHFWDGTGSGQPQGVCAVGDLPTYNYTLTGAQTTTITNPDDIIGWVHTLPVQYRRGAVIVTSDAVIKQLRTIKQNSQYVWLASDVNTLLAGGAPGTIMGIPYYISPFVDALATAKVVAVYGNFRYYEIFDRGASEMTVDPYTAMANWQVAMQLVKRTDALRTNDDAFCTLKMA